jgi:hypothetical protein
MILGCRCKGNKTPVRALFLGFYRQIVVYGGSWACLRVRQMAMLSRFWRNVVTIYKIVLTIFGAILTIKFSACFSIKQDCFIMNGYVVRLCLADIQYQYDTAYHF